MTEQRKAVIKNADMGEAMQQDAVDISSLALSTYNIEKVSSSQSRNGVATVRSLTYVSVSSSRLHDIC